METYSFKELFSDEHFRLLLPFLLKDQTTGKNIVWATETYSQYGAYYQKERQMFPDFNINLIMAGILLPRVQKPKEQQKIRTKKKAEVFTPSWICNKMNNYLDEQWFNKKEVFNIENDDNTWTVNSEKIEFDKKKKKRYEEWQRYVLSSRLEITCGEAPYLVSRYDATTGKLLSIPDRIGILDRKMRVISENVSDEGEWLKWTYKAFKSCYGFEYQGDSLFFARTNLVQSFIDYYTNKFGKKPTNKMLEKIAVIVSWNVWQMNGLNGTAPYGIPPDEFVQMSFIEETENNEPVYCKIKDWQHGRVLEYREMKGNDMKFDYCIGNPPYQGINHQQLYPDFYQMAKEIADCIDMIFPTGWQEPKTANNLSKLNNAETKEDKQIVFIDNRHNAFAKDVSGAEWTNIVIWKKGYDNGLNGYQKILTDGQNAEIRKLIYNKEDTMKPREIIELGNIVKNTVGFVSLQTEMSASKPYGIRKNIFTEYESYNLPEMQEKKINNDDIAVYGSFGRKMFVPNDYPFPKKSSRLSKFKVLVGSAWGNMSEKTGLGGAYADIIIAYPNEACTETYQESGCFDTYELVQKHAKYLMTKFCRALLYINKMSQMSTTAWGSVPVQDYLEDFWNGSVSEIDNALMRKYCVPRNIREFIDSHIQTRTISNIVNYKEMT